MTLIKIGKIVNTHGIKGELRLLSKFPYKDKVFINNITIYIDKKDKEIINTYISADENYEKVFDDETFSIYMKK